MKFATIATQNTEWGFFGTCIQNMNYDCTEQQVADIWDSVVSLVMARGVSAENAREYLDSRMGRHLCDNLVVDGKVDVDLDAFPRWAIRDIEKMADGQYDFSA